VALARVVDVIGSAARETQCEIMTMHTGVAIIAGFPAPARDASARLAAAALRINGALRESPLRFGLHAGSVTGAVVGTGGLSYWLWGDAIDLARRLAGVAKAGEIYLSPAAHADIKDAFATSRHGVVEVAGRGEMRAFLLQGVASAVPV
jgi:guanylate cyclase